MYLGARACFQLVWTTIKAIIILMTATKLSEVPMTAQWPSLRSMSAALRWKAEVKIGRECFVVSPYFQVSISTIHTASFSSDDSKVNELFSGHATAIRRNE